VPAEPAEGSLFLTQTTWEGTSPYTDIDTLSWGGRRTTSRSSPTRCSVPRT
jgi:hypothetical protein